MRKDFLYIEIVDINKVDNQHRKYFNCRCVCGKTFIRRHDAFRTDSSCGCKRIEYLKSEKHRNHVSLMTKKAMEKIKLPQDEYTFNQVYSSYRSDAKRKKRVFELSPDIFRSIIIQNCFYCGSEPKLCFQRNKSDTFKCNGVDRVDSSKGYVFENCVPCCKTCNIMKSNLDSQKFIDHISKILKFMSGGLSGPQ